MSTFIEHSKLTSWGNSQGVRLSKKIIQQANISDSQDFKVIVVDQGILLEPIQKEKTSAKELLSGWQDDGIKDSALNWGSSQGNEMPW